MDGNAVFASQRLRHRQALLLLGWHIQMFQGPQFHETVLRILRQWQAWFLCILKDIEERVFNPEHRAVLEEATFPVYLIIRQAIRDVEHILNSKRNLTEGMRPLPAVIRSFSRQLSRCEAFQIKTVLFLQRLPLLRSALKCPVPSEGSPWIATVPLEDTDAVKSTIETTRVYIGFTMDALWETLSPLRNFHSTKILEYEMLEQLDRKEGGLERLRMKIIAEECSNVVFQIMRTHPLWQQLVDDLLETQNDIEVQPESENGSGQALESFPSFVRRLMLLVLLMIGWWGAGMGFSQFRSLLYT